MTAQNNLVKRAERGRNTKRNSFQKIIQLMSNYVHCHQTKLKNI